MVEVSVVGAIVFGILTVLNVFLPFALMIPVIIAATAGSGLAYFIYTGWVTAEPNQWLLVIDNGKLVKAGIGLKTFKWPSQSYVKFASEIRKINFNAE